MTWYRLPLFLWSLYATSRDPGAGDAGARHGDDADRCSSASSGIGVFDPALGGDPVLFQHLFWFYSHPAVYIMILPGLGVVSELITAFSRKRIFGYQFIAWSSRVDRGDRLLRLGPPHVRGRHVAVFQHGVLAADASSSRCRRRSRCSTGSATLHKGYIRFDAPMLYALGFIGLFTIGGLTGLFLASLGADVHLHDTYFVVAHFHYIMVGAMVSAFFGGLHFWWPKITGRMYPEIWGQVAAVMIFFGFNLTFFPQFILGYLGMPRRYGILSAGIPGAERAVVRRRRHPRGGLSAAAVLSRLVAVPRRARAGQSLGGDRAGMADAIAATDRELFATPVVTDPPYYYPRPEERQHV